MPDSDILIHHGVKGMRWGVRKKRKVKPKRKPLTQREKVLVGSLVGSGIVIAAAGVTIASLKVRNTQHRISAAKAYGWVENMLDGIDQYQTVSPERFRSSMDRKNTYGVAEQFLRNRDMLKYIRN